MDIMVDLVAILVLLFLVLIHSDILTVIGIVSGMFYICLMLDFILVLGIVVWLTERGSSGKYVYSYTVADVMLLKINCNMFKKIPVINVF